MRVQSIRSRVLDSLRRWLSRSAGVEIERAGSRDLFALLLRRQIHRSESFFFVQIGAHDGVSFDPIYPFVERHRLRGLVVEPLPDVFRELTRAYRSCPGVIPVNVAVHASEPEMIMYRVDPTNREAPTWAAGIASFDPRHHEKSGTPREWIIVERVRCVTLPALLEEHEVTHIDLLLIDTEGYDAEIIRMVDFERMPPQLIRFEHDAVAYRRSAP